MNIYIKYEFDKSLIKIENYESIKSIINKYLEKNNNNYEVDNYFLDYNGIYLNNDFSLEKYNIENGNVLTLNKKTKGGSLKNRILTILIGLIIGLIPIFVLPMGFIPLTATLIKIIVEKSISSICKYLVCSLGKVTLYSRIKFLLVFLKYTAFLLMIYVLITFPLVIFCISLKGHTILDNPTSMCSPISAGKFAGMLLTVTFMLIYSCFKFGDYFFKFFINIFKLNYYTNTILNPYLYSGLKFYNRVKYVPVFSIPYLGEGIFGYFKYLGVVVNTCNIVLSSVKKLGCQMQLNKGSFLKDVMAGIKTLKKGKKSSHHHTSSKKSTTTTETSSISGDDNSSTQSTTFGVNNPICEPDLDQCCAPSNYVFIGDSLSTLIDNEVTLTIINSYKVYPIFILIIEALYGAGLDKLGYNSGLYGSLNEQKIYLNRILEKDINKLSTTTKDLIYTFLSNGDQQLINSIKEGLDTNLDIPDDTKKTEEAEKLKIKIDELEERMIIYSKQEKSAYIVGGSLFKTIFKIIFVAVFCNVVTTAKTGENIIMQMGQVTEISDMLKAGSATGIFLCVLYLLAIIILIVCGLFGFF